MRPLLSPVTAILLLAALILRIVKTFLITVVARDSVVYVEQTQAFLHGDWSAGLSAYYPPLYALVSASLALILGSHYGALGVSVMAGALLLLPYRNYATHFLSQDGLFGSSLVLVMTPSLVTCSAEILAESLYLLIFMSIVALLYKQQRQRAIRLAVIVGGLAGALTLIRPEGLVIVGGAAFLCGRRGVEDSARRPLLRSLCVALGLFSSLLVIAPYSFYLKQESGRWTFTKKEGTVIGGLAKFSEAEKAPVPEIHEHFKRENEALTKEGPPRSAKEDLSDLLASRPVLFLRKLVDGLGQCCLLIPRVSHWVLFLLACPGLFILGRSRRWPWELVVLLALHILVIATVTPQKRYLLPFVLFVVMGAGVSLGALAERLRRVHKRAYGVLFGVLLIVLGISAFKIERRSKGVVYELAGILRETRESSDRELRLASMESRVGYYAGVADRQLPRFASLGEMKRFLREQGITHLCFRKNWQERWCPWLKVEDVGELLASPPEGRTQLLLIRVEIKE